MIPQSTSAKSTRTRTPRQLQRKRTLDRASQKKKRERQKIYVQQIEKDLRDARKEIEYLRGIIQAIENESESGAHSIDSVNSGAHHFSATPPEPQGSTDPGSPVIPHGYYSFSPISEHGRRRTIECRCKPRIHISYSDCFEKTVFESMVKLYRHPTSTPAIPATPELADILFIREPETPVSKILHKLMRRPNMTDLLSQSAVYILAYRILRYRFFPSVSTYNDVPEWLRSTDIQDNIPHALYIDFVQFPRLRNSMVLGLVEIDSIREQFDADVGQHLSVNWPVSKSLLVTDDSCNTALNPEFERHVCTEENWSLNSGFAKKYPHIAPLVTIRDQVQ